MVFESLKKLFGMGKYQETPNHQMELINEEIDEFEREIQEAMMYSEQSGAKPPANPQPQALSVGAARTTSDILTPEEAKRVSGESEET
ncbi:MAG: hypothetical protein ACMUIE_04120 [Thermoplasmatota archaeon]